jgi:predicted transcriptional regulator
MSERTKDGFVRPRMEDLLPDQGDRHLFDEVSAALEAGSLMRCFREKANLSQGALADMLNMSQSRISQIENAEGRDGPTYRLLRRVASVCNINLTEVILTAVRGAEEGS